MGLACYNCLDWSACQKIIHAIYIVLAFQISCPFYIQYTYSKPAETSSSDGVVSSSDWSLSRSHVWSEDESATSKTGAILGRLPSLPPSEGRASVGPLDVRHPVSCKSIATVPVVALKAFSQCGFSIIDIYFLANYLFKIIPCD